MRLHPRPGELRERIIKRQAHSFRDDAYFILKIKGASPGTLQLKRRSTLFYL